MKNESLSVHLNDPAHFHSVQAAYAASPDKNALDGVWTYCMFLGYPRSGHSLIGSLLDAHPNMVVAHELHALAYIEAGYGKEQIFYLLLEKSRAFTLSGRKGAGGFQFNVPNQWQGRYRELRVIGDKKGGSSTRSLASTPGLLNRLAEVIPLERKFIHVVRNPFDNISTMSRRNGQSVADAIHTYFELARTTTEMLERIPQGDVFDLRHEAFLERPRDLLRELCHFLGEETTDDYLNDCASLVHPRPHETRFETPWTTDEKEWVARTLKEYPFLAGYAF